MQLFTELAPKAIEPLGPPARGDHPVSILHKPPRNRCSEAGRRARHQNDKAHRDLPLALLAFSRWPRDDAPAVSP